MTAGSLISIVDDDESIRDSTRTLLRSVGYEVATFESGELFLGSGTLADTRCLILDIRMPGMSGLEVQRRVNLSDCSVPVIFVTAHDDNANRKLAIEAGASEVFHKPFSANAFLTAVDTALTKSVCGGSEHPGESTPSRTVAVLIAEDDEMVRTLAATVLERAGFAALPACSGEAAIEILRNGGVYVDALLTDVQMGNGITGIVLAERVLNERPEIAVLVMSGFPNAELHARERNLRFLAKPFTPTKLVEQVRQALASNTSAQHQE